VRHRPFDFGGKTFDEIGYGWLDTTSVFANVDPDDAKR
jgi:hypothetical protein